MPGIAARTPRFLAGTVLLSARMEIQDDGSTVRLGDGLTVSPLGFGGMALTPVYGEVDPAEALEPCTTPWTPASASSTRRTSTAGAATRNSSPSYSRNAASEVQLATKFGLVGTPTDRLHRHPGRRRLRAAGRGPSLKRLGTDTIDLYYMHRRDLRVPIVETVEAMAGLVQPARSTPWPV